MKLTLAIPKGSLQAATVKLFEKAGFKIDISARSYLPEVDDDELELRLLRPQDIPRYIEKGVVDAGITGRDWLRENGADLEIAAELNYSKRTLRPCRWVLAVPEDSSIKSVKDLEGKSISTELVRVTEEYLRQNGVEASVEFSHGATEVKVPDLVDAIVELTETGESLRSHNLRIVDTVMETATLLVVNKESWADESKREKIESLVVLLQGAIMARDKVVVKMNVPQEKLDGVIALLPALREPTVSPLAHNGWSAVETVVDESKIRELIPKLKRAGAEGIIEFPLNKVIP
jgi:ATP phosphoribosyltransferase